MTGFRLASGGSAIDRTRPLRFDFAGRRLTGFAGDTVAAALIANGIRVAGRSFKYHRPRGVVAHGFGETNALMQVGSGGRSTANVPATEILLHEGLCVQPVNCWPSVDFDLGAANGLAAALLTAGFYYKTFMWPSWHLFEGFIRRAAGLGIAPDTTDPDRYDIRHASCDTLVVGGGETGIAEARAANGTVMLVDRGDLGAVPGVRILGRTTAVARLDHGLVLAVEAGAPDQQRWRERLWLIRAGSIVIATGAQERPLVFVGNDRPGVMLAGAVAAYVDRHGVAAGRNVLVAGNNDRIHDVADTLRHAGVDIAEVIDTRLGTELLVAHGRRGVSSVEVAGNDGRRRRIACDAVAMSGGFTPALQLFLHGAEGGLASGADGGLAPGADGTLAAGVAPPGVRFAGSSLPAAGPAIAAAIFTDRRLAKTAFIDFQTDVTVADVAQAVAENYRAPDHVKRYTVLGMGVDQGRLAVANGAEALARLIDAPLATVLPTKARPPLVPVAFATLSAGRPAGELIRPRRYLPAHDFHVARGAAFADYGWQRPSHYPIGAETLAAAAQREALAVRTTAGLFDGSPLGKIRVRGPDAGRFLDHIYVGTMSSLKPGRIRYGLMLNENGTIFDDGVAMRIIDDEYLLNATSGHAARVFDWLDEHLQCEWRHDLVLQDVTAAVATLAVAGPRGRAILAGAGTDLALDDFPHLHVRRGRVAGLAATVARVSFSGEACYEISVANGDAAALADALWAAGAPLGLVPYGIEALEILRTEKGYIHVGSDTDSETQPGDIGFGAAWPKKASDFIGRRSLLRPRSQAPDRKQLVGLQLAAPDAVLPMGAHLVSEAGASIGWVGSSYFSPNLGQGVALALLEAGRSRHGMRVRVHSEGRDWSATVCSPVFFDPDNSRLDG